MAKRKRNLFPIELYPNYGNRGKHVTILDETRKKISIANTGKKRPDIVGEKNPMKNPIISKKVSIKLTGRKRGWTWNKGLSGNPISPNYDSRLDYLFGERNPAKKSESRKKLSEKLSGENNPMFGKKGWNKGLTKETDQRVANVSEKLTGRVFTDEWRKNIGISNKGKSAWNKGLTKDTDERIAKGAKKISESTKGRESWIKGLTKETDLRVLKIWEKRDRSQQSELMKSMNKSEDFIKRRNEGAKKRGEILKEGYKTGRIKKHTNLMHTEEARKKAFISLDLKPNKKEKQLDGIIQTILPNEYKYVGNGEVIFGNRCPDFINCNGQKKLIEHFGVYWHSEKLTGRTNIQEEQLYKDYYSKYGFDTLIVWENELKNEDKLTEKIKKFNEMKIG